MFNPFATKTATTTVEPYVYEDDKELQKPSTSWYNNIPVAATIGVAAAAVVGTVAIVLSGAADAIEG